MPACFRLLSRDELEPGISIGTVVWNQLECQALINGQLSAGQESFLAEVDLDDISKVRAAQEGQALGLSQGPGFLVICGEITQVYDWGSCDIHIGETSVMIDEDEMAGYSAKLGERVSIAFQQLVLSVAAP